MRLSLLVLLFSCPLVLGAGKERLVSCRLLNLDRGAEAIGSLHAVSGTGQAVECPLPREALSEAVKLPAIDNRIEFRQQAADASVAVAEIPEGAEEVLVLFIAAPDGEKVVRPMVLDASEEAYPQGGTLVLNLSGKDIRFILGGQAVHLKPGKLARLERPEKRDDFNMAAVLFQFETERGWRKAYESMLRFPEGQRRLIVTTLDPAQRRPRVRVFLD